MLKCLPLRSPWRETRWVAEQCSPSAVSHKGREQNRLPFSVAFDTIVFSRVSIIGALRGGISMHWLQRTDRYVRYLFWLYLALKEEALGIVFSVS